MTRLAFVLALLITTFRPEAEIVDVANVGPVDFSPFDCRDITRSSVISRVCHDAETRRMVVQANGVYRQYCGLPKPAFDAFLNTPSMGRFFRSAIEGEYGCSPQQAWPGPAGPGINRP
jgi:hypothetical protein